MKHTGQLSEDDFKVQGHCCSITIPAIKTLDESIDFGHDRAAQDYLQQQYGITPVDSNAPNTPPLPQTRYNNSLTPPQKDN